MRPRSAWNHLPLPNPRGPAEPIAPLSRDTAGHWMQTSHPCPHQPFAGIFLDLSGKLEKEPTLASGPVVMMS